ncbi:uncharacterized protein LOC134301995 isoform X2 [Trichomycterus rosablanca]
MSTRLKECRQHLAEALDQATTDHSKKLEYCSPVVPELRSVLYDSCPLYNDHLENLYTCCLSLQASNHICSGINEASDSSWMDQEYRPERVGLTLSTTEAEARQALSGLIESSRLQTLKDFVAKLEFEIKLNQVCNRNTLNTNTHTPTATRRDSTGSGDSGVELGADSEEGDDTEDEDSRVVEMVLEMEQDYELYVL